MIKKDSYVKAAQSLPVYRRSEINRHVSMDNGVWVTYKGNVYDISKFIANHPGGETRYLSLRGRYRAILEDLPTTH